MKAKAANKSDENAHFYSMATSHGRNRTKRYFTKMFTAFIFIQKENITCIIPIPSHHNTTEHLLKLIV